jgi:hypothetical protein
MWVIRASHWVILSGVDLEPPLLRRFASELGPVDGSGFLEDAPDVKLDGVLAQVDRLGDLLVGRSIYHQTKNPPFEAAEFWDRSRGS